MKETSATIADASFGGGPDLTPVAVTRWSARLADPQCERDYLLHRFAGDCRRASLLMWLVSAASALNFGVEFYAHSHDADRFAALLPLFAIIWLPLAGWTVLMRIRSPGMLEALMVAAVAIGAVIRLGVLTFHSDVKDMWMTLMVGIVFVI